ncbi:MAG: hypothetical protein ABR589_11865 [Chthoniobacterales bacterium]
MSDRDLDRLLRAAAGAMDADAEMPFGFDTRVLAAREAGAADDIEAWELARLLRGIAVFSFVLALLASSAAYWEVTQNTDEVEPFSNAYAIADTAIAAEFSP